jgi:invasion protein IalB
MALAIAPWQAGPVRAAENNGASMRLAQQRPGPAAPTPAPAQRPARPATPTEPIVPPAAQAPDGKDKPAEAGWVSRCVSDTRQGGLDCSVEQTATLTKTGQLFAAVTIRVPPDTRQPVMMVQLPVGIFIPAGVTLQVDQQAAVPLVVQTCDLKGCYAGSPLQAESIIALKTGKRLAISFQTLSKESITVPFVLDKFSEAFGKIQ